MLLLICGWKKKFMYSWLSAYDDYSIGEISLMKDLTKTMDITTREQDEDSEDALKVPGKTEGKPAEPSVNPASAAATAHHAPPPPKVSVDGPEDGGSPAAQPDAKPSSPS